MALKDTYFTISEAARELGVTRQTISRWIANGIIPAEKIGREKLIEKKALRRQFKQKMDDIFDKYIHKWISETLISFIRNKYKFGNEVSIVDIGQPNQSTFVFSVVKKDGKTTIIEIPKHQLILTADPTKKLLSVQTAEVMRKTPHMWTVKTEKFAGEKKGGKTSK